MIILTVLRFVRELIDETNELRRVAQKKYPYLDI